jgi:hypothetical protein
VEGHYPDAALSIRVTKGAVSIAQHSHSGYQQLANHAEE